MGNFFPIWKDWVPNSRAFHIEVEHGISSEIGSTTPMEAIDADLRSTKECVFSIYGRVLGVCLRRCEIFVHISGKSSMGFTSFFCYER